ncbi:MAG: CotH kinase family protein [Rhodoluna sp.]|nr:CotH kinase family protein [Rhodoluna sp.]
MTKLRLALALVLTVLLTGVSLQPAAAITNIKLTDIYSVAKITEVYLEVPTASETSLNNWSTLKKYVTAKVKFVQGELESDQITIGLRLKGSTSLQPLKQKPSMRIQFNWGDALKGQRFLGLKNMTLHSLTQDNSLVHELGAYKLYNAMGVVAPSTGWAEVFVNGKSKGVYLNVETPDDIFLSKRFKDPTQHLFEGQAFADLKPGNDSGGESDGKFTVDEGWATTPNKADLTALIEAANVEAPKAWWDGLAKRIDRTSMVKMFAVDNFLGHWDGYSGPIINNYFLRSNSKSVFTFLPWGADQTFGENRQTPELLDTYTFAMDKPDVGYPWIKLTHKTETLERGLLFRKCLAYKPCQTLYLQQLKATSVKATAIKLPNLMANAGKVVDFLSNDNNRAEQKRNSAFIAAQHKAVAALLKQYKIK